MTGTTVSRALGLSHSPAWTRDRVSAMRRSFWVPPPVSGLTLPVFLSGPPDSPRRLATTR